MTESIGKQKEVRMKLTKILVPLDGSALAETAIPTAVQFAKEQGVAVVLSGRGR